MNESSPSANSLPAPVLDALQRGNLVEAIKLMRSIHGLSLTDAKNALDAYQRRKPQVAFPSVLADGSLPANVVEALQQGKKIEAIRRLREQTGLGLKDAHDQVEAFRRTHPQSSDLSPGQVRTRGGALWWATALVIACLLGYWLFRRLG